MWDEACQAAFDGLKKAMGEAPVLPYPNPNLPYLLDTDTSTEGVGAVLSQVEDGKEHVVAYYIAKFSSPQCNYCVTRKELLAVVKSLEHFHPYLYGAEFTTRIDDAALQWLKSLKVPEGQLARWLGRLEQYNLHIVHRPGRVHGNVDSLSRRPCEAGCSICAQKDSDGVCLCLHVLADAAEGSEAQREDSDLTPILQWLEAGGERPSWEVVAPQSPS